jgi:CRP-like cAMP-binding protein
MACSMLRRDAKMELLRQVTLFNRCSERELRQIARIADELDFPAGKTLIRQGAPGRQFFVVIEGDVLISQDGKKFPPRGGSEFFGEIALVLRSPATATVETVAPTRALVIGPREFRALLDRTPSIQRRILYSFSERLAPHVI